MKHHAYLLEGDSSQVNALIRHVENEFEIELKQNPNVSVITRDLFSVDDAREFQSSLIHGGEGKYYFIAVRNMTREAENALLKSFEDPPRETKILLMISKIDKVAPTLRSRCEILNIKFDEVDSGNFNTSLCRKFVLSELPDRLKIIEQILKIYEKEGNKSAVSIFLKELVSVFREAKESPTQDKIRGYQSILLALKYLEDKSSSPKILLEYVMVSMPIIK